MAIAADSIYIVVEYVREGSLDKYLREHRNQLDSKALLQMAKDIVTGKPSPITVAYSAITSSNDVMC